MMKSKLLDSGTIVATINPGDPEYARVREQLVTHYAAQGEEVPRDEDPGNSSAILAGYYAALFNAITQAGHDVGDDLLENVNDDLQDSDWIVEFDGGLWQARENGDAASEGS